MKKNLLKTILFSVLVFLFSFGTLISNAQVTLLDNMSGSRIWTCPPNVTSVSIECWGAGGAGGGLSIGPNYGGGGGGGSYAIYTNVAVVPGTSYNYTIGAGGAGSLSTGADGTASNITIISIYSASGGKGGSTSSSGGAGGAGGTGGTYNGGNGGTANTSVTGSGGGGAGSGGNGVNGTASTFGGAGGIDNGTGGGAGGNGAAGKTSSSSGNTGTTVGGGGSGAFRSASTASSKSGGNGGNGQIRITAPCGALINSATLTYNSSTNVNWSSLAWSLGHLPTACESVLLTLNRPFLNLPFASINVVLDVDVKVFNFSMVNSSPALGQTIFGVQGTGAFGNRTVIINGDMVVTSPGLNSLNRCVFSNNYITTIYGNVDLGRKPAVASDGHSAIGSYSNVPGQTYNLYGDMNFNPRGYTTDEWAVFNFNKAGTQYINNYTSPTDTTQPVLFETINIGTTNATTVIMGGTNYDAYIEAERTAGLTIGVNSTLVLPANYSLNKLTIYANVPEPFTMLAGATLKIGGDKGLGFGGVTVGVPGSNFPSSFDSYVFDPTSKIEYNGSNAITQTIYDLPSYTNLLATNGSGTGRAQKITTGGITANTSFNINALTDVTLGTLGSSTQPVASAGPLTIQATGGLYCNANVVAGAGAFTMNNGCYLGMGHTQGISNAGAIGNIQMAGSRIFNTTGNYIYNGILPQVTGNGLPSTINDLTTDNPTVVTIATNQVVNGVNLLKQGVFDVVATKITLNGVSIMNSAAGKMNASQGIVEMMGTSGTAQNLSGNWFVNKTIATLTNANTKGITVATAPADTLLISKALNYGASTSGSTITTNDNLTLLSRFAGTANFGEVKSGNTIVGKVNIERYLFAQKAWRFLAAPVQAGTSPNIANAWRESKSALSSTGYGAQITGPTGPAVAANGGELDFKTQRGSIKYYDDANNVWIELSNTTTTKVANTQGYMLFVRGDRGAANTTAGAGTATNMRIKGDIRTGDQTFNILAAGVGVTKFQSIGNPYPSEINFASITKTNSYDGFIVWSPILTGLYGVGGYQNYSKVGANYRLNGSPVGAIRNTIQSGEAFFVQNTNAPAGTITIKEADKGTGSTLVSRASNVDVVVPTINMQLFEKDGTGDYQLMDGATASFDDNYSQAADNNDMVKFTNANDNLFIKSNNKELVVERRPVPTEADSIQLGLTGTRAAAYRLQIDPYVFDNITVAPFLVDKYLQTTTALSTNDSTNYDFTITADAASKAADRFVIVFKQGATTHFTTIAASRNTDKTITVNFGTANEKNVTNYTVEQSNDGTNFIALPTKIAPTSNIGGNPTYTKQDATASKAANWYRVKTANSNGSTKYSAIAMVAAVVEVAADATPAINIYPNPVQNGNIQVHFNNQAKGSYSIKVLNQAGQTVGVEQVQIANNNTQKAIQINNLAAGSYQVVITNASGEQIIVPMLAK